MTQHPDIDRVEIKKEMEKLTTFQLKKERHMHLSRTMVPDRKIRVEIINAEIKKRSSI